MHGRLDTAVHRVQQGVRSRLSSPLKVHIHRHERNLDCVIFDISEISNNLGQSKCNLVNLGTAWNESLDCQKRLCFNCETQDFHVICIGWTSKLHIVWTRQLIQCRTFSKPTVLHWMDWCIHFLKHRCFTSGLQISFFPYKNLFPKIIWQLIYFSHLYSIFQNHISSLHIPANWFVSQPISATLNYEGTHMKNTAGCH